MDDFFQHRENRPIEDTLSLPLVNNWITTHRVVRQPQTARFRVGFDNAFASKVPLHEVPTPELLQNRLTQSKYFLVICDGVAVELPASRRGKKNPFDYIEPKDG